MALSKVVQTSNSPLQRICLNSEMPNVVQGAVRFGKIYLMPKDRRRRGRGELGHSLRKPLARDMSEDDFGDRYTRSG
jgi:hypothetical protein